MLVYQLTLILLMSAGAIGSITEKDDQLGRNIFFLIFIGTLTAFILTLPETVY